MNQERAKSFLLDLPSVQNDLPFSPALLTRLFRLTDDAATSPLTDVATAVAEDQGLSARLLAMANSAFYGLQAQVATVDRAVAVLGLREVRGLVLALGMRGLADVRPLPPEFALTPYLDHQLAVGVTAMALARECAAMAPEDAFTAGLLHDLGKLVTALYRPDDWRAEAELAAAQALAWHEAEECYWGLDHGLIGAMVLRAWNLPETLIEPVNWHHAPQAAPGDPAPSRLIGLADALVREHAGTAPGEIVSPAPSEDFPDEPLALALGLTPQSAGDIARQAMARHDVAALATALA